MITYAQALSGLLFYVLGSILLGACLLLNAKILNPLPRIVLESCDLVFLYAACVYGGVSLYKSLTKEKSSLIIGMSIIGMLVFVFIGLSILHFWDVLGLSTNE